MSEPTPVPVRKFSRRRLTLGVVVALVVGIVVATSVGRHPISPKLPDPNGYSDFVRAGLLVRGPWPNKGDLDKASVQEVRAFIEANKAALDMARVGLTRECMVPLENSQAGLEKHFDDLSRIRAIGRLLKGEAIVAEADGRIADATRAARDQLAIGQAITQEGLGVDHSLGSVLQWQAIVGLRKLRGRIPRPDITLVLRDLEAVEAKRVPIDAIMTRWKAWYQGAHHPLMRFQYGLIGLDKTAMADEVKLIRAGRDKVERDLRFLQVELAIQAFHEDKTTWPRSVDDLVPGYLKAVPIDPGTGKPINYPANASGELTDDLTSIARPDGEVIAPKP